MKNKPWVVKVIASALVIVPFVTAGILQLAKSKGYPIEKMSTVLIEFYLLVVASLIAAYGVWKVRIWGFVMMLALGAIVIGFDVWHIVTDPQTLNVWDFSDIVLVIAAVAFITRENVRRPFFDPKVRWWERPRRYVVKLNGHIEFEGNSLERPIFDLSEKGCLVGVEAFADIPETFDLKIDYQGAHFKSQVKRVRLSESPPGIGLMFVDVNNENKSELKRILKAWKLPTPPAAMKQNLRDI